MQPTAGTEVRSRWRVPCRRIRVGGAKSSTKRNLLAVRAEEQLTLAVKYPRAFVYGTFDYMSG